MESGGTGPGLDRDGRCRYDPDRGFFLQLPVQVIVMVGSFNDREGWMIFFLKICHFRLKNLYIIVKGQGCKEPFSAN